MVAVCLGFPFKIHSILLLSDSLLYGEEYGRWRFGSEGKSAKIVDE